LHHFNAGIFLTGLQPKFFSRGRQKTFKKLLKRILSFSLSLSLSHTHTHTNTHSHTYTRTHKFTLTFYRMHTHALANSLKHTRIRTHIYSNTFFPSLSFSLTHTRTQPHTFCKHKDKNTWQRNLHVRKMGPKSFKRAKKRRKNCAFVETLK